MRGVLVACSMVSFTWIGGCSAAGDDSPPREETGTPDGSDLIVLPATASLVGNFGADPEAFLCNNIAFTSGPDYRTSDGDGDACSGGVQYLRFFYDEADDTLGVEAGQNNDPKNNAVPVEFVSSSEGELTQSGGTIRRDLVTGLPSGQSVTLTTLDWVITFAIDPSTVTITGFEEP